MIAGAGLAGARVAEGLRARDWDGRILLVGDEPHPPYERPALSKELLAGTKTEVSLRPEAFWDDRQIELRLGQRVEAVDADRHTALVGGEPVDWHALVIATGSRARPLAGPPGVLTLRTLDDARALARQLTPETRLAVVGAGFIGGEVASTALALAGSITVIDPLAAPLERILGAEVGAILADRYRSHGVDLRLGVGVEGFTGTGHVEAVCLSDGTTIPADLVLVGIGAIPCRLDGPGSIDVDEYGRSELPDVYAAGDVAAWWRPSLGRRIRVEHWTSAAGQARSVASTIAGEPVPYDDTPYFWSDQFGLRLQHVGHAEHWNSVELTGDDDSFTARYSDGDGTLLAALAVNRPTDIAPLRRELAK